MLTMGARLLLMWEGSLHRAAPSPHPPYAGWHRPGAEVGAAGLTPAAASGNGEGELKVKRCRTPTRPPPRPLTPRWVWWKLTPGLT